MFLIMLLTLLIASEPVIDVTGFDIFRRPEHKSVAVGPTGTLYLLIPNEHQVFSVSATGQKLQPFSREGQGPGELSYPASLTLFKGQLVVRDNNGLNFFEEDGRFVRRLSPPWGDMCLTQKGALLCDALQSGITDPSPGQLSSFDNAFLPESRQVVFDFARPHPDSYMHYQKFNNTIKIFYTPTPEQTHFVSDMLGEHVYLYIGGQTCIHVFDGKTHQLQQKIELPKPPTMNRVWAEKQTETFREKNKSRQRKIVVEAYIPEFFPALRDMSLNKNTLYITLWSAAPDFKIPVLAFDEAGTPSSTDLDGTVFDRLIGTWGEYAWVFGNLKDEEQTFSRVALADLNSWCRTQDAKMVQAE